jgi:GNAT superfamily N-acetyltransferase
LNHLKGNISIEKLTRPLKTSVKFIEPHDSEQLLGLLHELGYDPDSVQMAAMLDRLVRSDMDYLIGSFDGERLVGWLHATIMHRLTSGKFVEIVGLIVSNDYRRRGIGKALVEKSLHWATSHENASVRVRCNRLRSEAHLFYDTMGFSEQKEQKVLERQLREKPISSSI